MSHQLLQRVKVESTEAALVSSTRFGRIYDIPMHRAQMLQQMRLLLEHRDAQSTSEWLFARVHAQMRLQVPRHSKLLSTILTAVLTNRIIRVRVARRARILIVVPWMMVGMLVFLLLLLKGGLRKAEQVVLTARKCGSECGGRCEICRWRSMRPWIERGWRCYVTRTRLTGGVVVEVSPATALAVVLAVIRMIGGMWTVGWGWLGRGEIATVEIVEIYGNE